MHFDDILKQYLGEFGRYQKIQFTLVCLPTIFCALHALSWTFTGYVHPHRCRYPGEYQNTSYKPSQDEWIWKAYNITNETAGSEESKQKYYTSCKRIAGVSYGDLSLRNKSLEDCTDDYVWDKTIMEESAVRHWFLVCDRDWVPAFVQGMYYLGQFIGSLVLGPLSDKIGRKTVFIVAILIQIVCGAVAAYIPWWPLFAILRIGVGFAHPGIFMVAVVIGMELVGPSRRMLGGIASGLFFALGQVILGALAYGCRYYQTLQLALTLPALVFVGYWWLVPESARWLLSQRRFAEADAILQRAARINRTTLPSDWYEQLSSEPQQSPPTQKETRKGFRGVLDAYASLFKTPNIRRRSILTSCICWPAVSMAYYGLAMNPGFLGGDNRLAFIIGGILEFPSLLIVMLTINVMGRKFLCMAGFFLAAICLFLTLIVIAAAPDADIAKMLLVVLGKSGLTGVYAVLYIFTPELYPTTIRSTGMGLCSMIARVGAFSASFVAMYLAKKHPIAACFIFAVLATAGGIACLFLPETAGQTLPETIEDAENFGRNLPMFKFMERRRRPDAAEADKAPEAEVLMKPVQQPAVDEEPKVHAVIASAPSDDKPKEA